MVLVEFPDHPGRAGRRPAARAAPRRTSPSGWPSRSASSPDRAGSPSPASSPSGARRDGYRPLRAPRRDLRRRASPQIGRQVDRSGLQLTIDAILAAVDDAGLTVDDIDGLAMFPGGGAANLPGLREREPLRDPGHAAHHHRRGGRGQVEGMSLPFYGPAQAVATGQARHVVMYRTVKEGSAARNAGGRPAYGSVHPVAEGPLAWLLPVGMLSPVCQIAPYATRYLHEFGVTREQLAWIPVTQRAHAALNPDAVYRDAADRRRLPRVTHDLDADLPLRLRRPRRRRHRHRRVCHRDRARPAGPRPHRGDGRCRRRTTLVGTVGGHGPRRPRHRLGDVEPHRPATRRRRRRPALRRLHDRGGVVAGSAGVLRHR